MRGLVRPVQEDQRASGVSPAKELSEPLAALLKPNDPLQGPALKAALIHQIPLDLDVNRSVLHATDQPVEFRIQALEQLLKQLQGEVSQEDLATELESVRGDSEDQLRLRIEEALRIIADRPAYLMQVFEQGASERIRQLAVRRVTKLYDTAPGIHDWLLLQLDLHEKAEIDAGLVLDLLRACESSGSKDVQERAQKLLAGTGEDRVEDHRWALEGGDASRGRKIFMEHPVAQCMRCHVKEGQGGVSGPPLDGLAETRNRRQILQSLVDPSAVITDGFSAQNGLSAMPEIHWILQPEEIRDLLEYVGSK